MSTTDALSGIVERLLESDEPCIRYMVRTRVLGEDPDSSAIMELREEVRRSPRVATLLSERLGDGRAPGHAYAKWTGAQWLLPALAEMGYPKGDPELAPMVDQVCEKWLSKEHLRGVRAIDGRSRRCASQEGNALYSMLVLGFADERADQLVDNLMAWQWPDGGWNCDRNPTASISSFHETLIPMRALALYGRLRNSARAKSAAASALAAAEVFLRRRLFRRVRDGAVMDTAFTQLHYPCYWHYDILGCLKALAEAGLTGDPRCQEALDLLESKRLPDGGFPAEGKYYRVSANIAKAVSGRSLVSWGSTSAALTNEFVTADALYVLGAFGRG